MATHSTTISTARRAERAAGQTAPNPGIVLPSLSLWWREIVRFYRMRSRVIGVIASPLLFWIVIGSGFGDSFRAQTAAGGQRYLEFFFPGALIMIVLFTSIFTMMSVIEDRREGFLLSVLVAPISRTVIVLGKVLGGPPLPTIRGFFFPFSLRLIVIISPLSGFGGGFFCLLLFFFPPP